MSHIDPSQTLRRCSSFGPVVMMAIGGLLLWHNLHPKFEVFDWLEQYWPFVLVVCGLIRLADVVFER